ncbi:MAG TPA: GreA/GreB family elongation factor [Polyangiales bacterium]|nr:GreA/GreB family elongation factor [Polyangiales bacterium]
MDKQFMVAQLAARIRDTLQVALREQEAAALEARDGATPSEKRDDARTALEFSNLARAQGKRALAAREELARIERFRPGSSGDSVRLGDIVEIEDGAVGRTIFLAPVGAGIELTMPEGDGFVTVVTPASPLGKALIGRELGDVVEISLQGKERDWTVTFIG